MIDDVLGRVLKDKLCKTHEAECDLYFPSCVSILLQLDIRLQSKRILDLKIFPEYVKIALARCPVAS